MTNSGISGFQSSPYASSLRGQQHPSEVGWSVLSCGHSLDRDPARMRKVAHRDSAQVEGEQESTHDDAPAFELGRVQCEELYAEKLSAGLGHFLELLNSHGK